MIIKLGACLKIDVIIIAFVCSLISVSCARHSIDIPERPANETENEPELNDDAMRISGEVMTLRYDDGGVLFCRTADGIISAVRLADDISFLFDPVTPSLKINSTDIRLESATLAKESANCQWYRLVTADRHKNIYIVVNGL